MKVCAYIPLLYGKEYLAASIQSYEGLVDKIYVLYTPKPSYGYNAHFACPESEQELKDIVFSTTNKAEWIHVNANNEGAHRGYIAQFERQYDLTVATDYDEVWKPEDLARALQEAYDQPFRRYGIDGFVHFWKSFNKVCYDGFRPVRIYKNNGHGETILRSTIYHFGYAISETMMRYKWSIHGHYSELKPNWIEGVYKSDRLEDLHPVSNGLWNAVDFDKNTLPDFLKAHPNFNKVSCL